MQGNVTASWQEGLLHLKNSPTFIVLSDTASCYIKYFFELLKELGDKVYKIPYVPEMLVKLSPLLIWLSNGVYSQLGSLRESLNFTWTKGLEDPLGLLNSDLILSCRERYPIIINFGHCVASSIAERKNRRHRSLSRSLQDAVASFVESLCLYGYAGNTAISLFAFARTPTYFTNQIFIVHTIAWLCVNYFPGDLFYWIVTCFIPSLLVNTLDNIDNIYTFIHLLQISQLHKAGNYAYRVTVGLVYFYGGHLQRVAYYSCNRMPIPSKVSAVKIWISLVNIALFSFALYDSCELKYFPGRLLEGDPTQELQNTKTRLQWLYELIPLVNYTSGTPPKSCYEISDFWYSSIIIFNLALLIMGVFFTQFKRLWRRVAKRKTS